MDSFKFPIQKQGGQTKICPPDLVLLPLLAVQGHQGAGADAVGPRLQQGLGLLKGADAAGGLDAHVRADVVPEEGHILHGGSAGGEAGGGLDKVRPGHGDHPAGGDFFFLSQLTGLHDDLQDVPVAGGLHRLDLLQHALPVAGLGQADVHDHVDLVGAVADGVPSAPLRMASSVSNTFTSGVE